MPASGVLWAWPSVSAPQGPRLHPFPRQPTAPDCPVLGYEGLGSLPKPDNFKGPTVALQVSVGWAELSVTLPAPTCFSPLLFPGVIQGHTLVSALHAQPLRLPSGIPACSSWLSA